MVEHEDGRRESGGHRKVTQAVDETVHAISPDGRTVEVRPDKLTEAADAGYQLLTPEQFAARELEAKEGLTGAAKAFAGSGASTLTLGLSDVAGGALFGDEFRENRRLREIANPASSLAGSAAGIIAPIALTGGGSLLAEAAELSPLALAARGGTLASRGAEALAGAAGLTGESLAGRVALGTLKSAAQGAFEGGAMGAGQALSEAALAPGGDYNNLAQRLWAGAIDGAEFGALGGGALGAAGELGGAVARKIGGSFSAREMLQDIADAKALKSVGYQGADISKLSRAGKDEMRKVANAVRETESIGTFDSLKTAAGKLDAAKSEAGEVLGEMRKALDEARTPGQGVNVRGVLDEASTRIEELQASAQTRGEDRLAKRFGRELERFKQSFPEGEPVSFEEAHNFRRKLDNELSNYGKKTYPGTGKGRPADAFEQQIRNLRADLETQFETDADAVMRGTSPEFRQQYMDAKARYGTLKEITGVANKRVGGVAGLADLNPMDIMAGMTGLAHAGPAGVLAAAATRALRSTQADRIVGKLAHSLANLDTEIDSSIGKWVSGAQRAAKGTVSAARAPALREQFAAADDQKARTREYYAKLQAVEREAKSAPGTLVSIPGAPKTEAAAEAARRAAAAYLMKEAPVGPAQIKHPVLARVARQAPPNIVDTLKWLRKVKTVEDPKSALTALNEGRLTTDHIDALKATAPALLDQFRRIAVEKITDKNADMDYDDRIQLGVLLGVPTDPSLRPESIRAGQAVYEKRRQAQGQQEQAMADQAPPKETVPGNRPAGFDSSLDQMEMNSGRI